MPIYDVIVIGAGPGGATAGMVCAQAGLRVLILEKTSFPRFQIGESLLPRNGSLIEELSLGEAMKSVPCVSKLGIEFSMGHELAGTCFPFDLGLLPGAPTYNVERAGFDLMLLEQAKARGAEVRERTSVRSIAKLADNDVAIETDDGVIRCRYLLDASGQATVVARHLRIRQTYSDPIFQKVAYFEHFENVKRRAGKEEGYPLIVMCEEGWFWAIPINDRQTSIGFVANSVLAKQIGISADRMLEWAIKRCPAIADRMRNATGPSSNQVIADFSYACRPFAGPGYFLIGDAAAFLDPIFSTGVCLSMLAAREAAKAVTGILKERMSPASARKRYIRFVDGGTRVYFKLIRQYYQHSFRELFLNGQGPMQVHRAVLSILAGHVFPRPPFALRWRLRLFDFLVWFNQYRSIVPRREHFSLLVDGGPS